MMGDANPNPVVSMGLEMMECGVYTYYYDPVMWTLNGAQRHQAKQVAPDAKTPAKKQPSGLKRLGLTTAKAVSNPKPAVIPRVARTRTSKGKRLTPFRKNKIRAFNDMIQLNPDEHLSKRMGSSTWIHGLVKFMNELNFTEVAPADVIHWLKGSEGFFQSELARVVSKQKLQQSGPDPSHELPKPTTMEGGTVRPLAQNHEVPVMASAPESSFNSKDASLDAGDDLELYDPEFALNSLSILWSPQAPSGIEEINATPNSNQVDLDSITPSSSTLTSTANPNLATGGHNDDLPRVLNLIPLSTPAAKGTDPSSSCSCKRGKKESGGFLYQSEENTEKVRHAKMSKRTRDLTKQKMNELEDKLEKVTMERDSLIGFIRSKGMEPPIGKDQLKVNQHLADEVTLRDPELAKPKPQQKSPDREHPNPTSPSVGFNEGPLAAMGWTGSSHSMGSPQAPSGIEEIKPTPNKITEAEPLTILASTGVLYCKHDVTSDLAQVPIAVQNLYSEGAIELCGDLNPMLLHLAETYQLPADKEVLQLFTKVLLKLVEKAVKEGSGQEVNLEACLHAMCAMKATVEWGASGH